MPRRRAVLAAKVDQAQVQRVPVRLAAAKTALSVMVTFLKHQAQRSATAYSDRSSLTLCMSGWPDLARCTPYLSCLQEDAAELQSCVPFQTQLCAPHF